MNRKKVACFLLIGVVLGGCAQVAENGTEGKKEAEVQQETVVTEPTPDDTKVSVTPEPTPEPLHTDVILDSAGDPVTRIYYAAEDNVIVLDMYKDDVLVQKEKWYEGDLEFVDGKVFETPSWSFWVWWLDDKDIPECTELYRNSGDGSVIQKTRRTLDGTVLYDELHEYEQYYDEDGLLIYTESIYINGELGADAKYGDYSKPVWQKRPIELNFYPIKGVRIELDRNEGNSAFLTVTEDETYELSSHVRECYVRDEEHQLVSGQVFTDGVLTEEYEFAPGGYFSRIKESYFYAKTITIYREDGTTTETRYDENGEIVE